MSKTYPEALGEWVAKGEASRPDRNLVAFMAVRDELRAAVEAGYSVKAIWRNMGADGRVVASYYTFRRHMNRYLRPSESADRAVPTLLSANRERPGLSPEAGNYRRVDSTSKTTLTDAIPGFTFN